MLALQHWSLTSMDKGMLVPIDTPLGYVLALLAPKKGILMYLCQKTEWPRIVYPIFKKCPKVLTVSFKNGAQA